MGSKPLTPAARKRKQEWDRIISRKKRRGLPTLDRLYPTWRERIDPDRLDMGEHRHCLIGQLFPRGEFEWQTSGYQRGLKELSGLKTWRELFEWSVAEGFDVFIEHPDSGEKESYDLLTRVWVRELTG